MIASWMRTKNRDETVLLRRPSEGEVGWGMGMGNEAEDKTTAMTKEPEPNRKDRKFACRK